MEFWLDRDKITMLGKARVYTHSCTCIGHCLGLAFFLLNGVLSSFLKATKRKKEEIKQPRYMVAGPTIITQYSQ